MADAKLTALSALTTPSLDDLVYLVDDPGGTPASKKVTLRNLLKASGITYSFAFTYATASLNAGVTVYTPTVGELLMDAWVEVDTAFDGTTPLADLWPTGASAGLFADSGSLPVALAVPDLLQGGVLASFGNSQNPSLSQAFLGSSFFGFRPAPAKFTTTDPLLLVVSQDGTQGGMAIGGGNGAAILYFVVATPLTSPG